eukprot:jgi/Botrbrau1/11678/Bobra.0195s0009.1
MDGAWDCHSGGGRFGRWEMAHATPTKKSEGFLLTGAELVESTVLLPTARSNMLPYGATGTDRHSFSRVLKEDMFKRNLFCRRARSGLGSSTVAASLLVCVEDIGSLHSLPVSNNKILKQAPAAPLFTKVCPFVPFQKALRPGHGGGA